MPSVTGGSGNWLVNESDIMILFDKDEEGKHILRVGSTKDFDAKQRIDFNKNVISGGNSAKEAYNNLLKEFNKAVEKRNKELGITEKQIKEYYKELEKFKKSKSFNKIVDEIIEECQELGLSKKDNAKEMKEEFGVMKFSQLNYEDAKKRLENLKKRNK